EEVWIDKAEDFTESEIQDVFHQLAEGSDHPISNLIAASTRQKDRPLIKLEKMETKENLGIVAEFKDLQRRKTTAVLAGLTWQKILQHEISEEGMDKVREWKQKKAWTIFLSLNRQIVAAIAWKNPSRNPFSAAIDSKIPRVLLSSLPHLAENFFEEQFNQVCLNLLPAERISQKKYWYERTKHSLEIKSAWDSLAEDDLVFVSARKDLKEQSLGVLDGEFDSVLWAQKAASKFEQSVTFTFVLLLSASLASFLVQIPASGLLISGIIYISSLAWFALRPIK
ncbi:MAG: hypothetical protein JWQ35_344, partial [Bacteriovoracaceae bacterium]|nr:hypothetical protein [Bacteriovoracaceae bacterium]